MLCDFYPWKINVDKESTVKLYEEKDFAADKDWNRELINYLNDDEKAFFDGLGVDLMKIEVEEKEYDFHEDDEEKKLLKISGHFAIKGELVEIPSWQAFIYEDDEVLGKMPETMSKKESEVMVHEVGNRKISVVFKPPYFRVKEGYLRVWNSGYVVGSLLIFED